MGDMAKYLAEKYGAGGGSAAPVVKKKRKKKVVKNVIQRKGFTIVDGDAPAYVEPAKDVITDEDEEAPVVFDPEEEDRLLKEKQAIRAHENASAWTVVGDKNDDDDQSPPRRRHDTPDSDQSPPRRRGGSDDDQSPPRRRHDTPDSDQSPPRRRPADDGDDQSPPRRRRHDTPDSDQSPPRRRADADEDQSPPRRRRHDTPDSDQSPPRRGAQDQDLSPPRRRGAPKASDDADLSPPRRDQGKRPKMSHGGSSGLVRGIDLKEDLGKRKAAENERFKAATEEQLGQNAATVVRDKHGRKLEFLTEMLNKEKGVAGEEAQMVWGRGVVQLEEKEAAQRELEEVSKNPNYVGRTADDEAMNARLREVDRWGDPMAGRVKKKAASNKPKYVGAWPPNRFNIPPGHRWDGVVRSVGFEAKWFQHANARKSNADIAHMWSTEDM